MMEEISLPEKCHYFSSVVSFYQRDDMRLEAVEEQCLAPMVTMVTSLIFHNDSRASLPTSSSNSGRVISPELFITTRLDYCSALYVGLSQTSLSRLQRVQHAAARLLRGAKHHSDFSFNPLAPRAFSD